MKTTYINGDKVEYTGKSQMLHGALAYEVIFLEGLKKGQTRVTYKTPVNNIPKKAPLFVM